MTQMKATQYKKLADALEKTVSDFCLEEAASHTEARSFGIDFLKRGVIAHDNPTPEMSPEARLRELCADAQYRADVARLVELMTELLEHTAPGDASKQLTELMALYDGMHEAEKVGSNDLTMADFGDAFCLAMTRWNDPKWHAYVKAKSMLDMQLETENLTQEEYDLLDGALQVGLEV